MIYAVYYFDTCNNKKYYQDFTTFETMLWDCHKCAKRQAKELNSMHLTHHRMNASPAAVLLEDLPTLSKNRSFVLKDCRCHLNEDERSKLC